MKKENSLQKAIGEIEKEIDIKSFIFKGVNIWPVIRISIILSRKKVSAGSKVKKRDKLLFLLLGVREYFNLLFNNGPSASHVFLSSWHYKVKEDGIFKDRILDPILNWIDHKKKKFVIFEFTHHLSYRKDVSYPKRVIRLQPILYLMSFFWRISFMLEFTPHKFKGDYDQLNKIILSKNLPYQVNRSFFWRIYLLEKQKNFFKKVLKDMSASHVGMVCYYDFKSLALTWASNELGIKSIDFQHGVQGPYHMAYASWSKNITSNSPFFPSHFWVWDKPSQKTILEWKKPSKVILGTNKWMEDRIKFDKPEIILCTLQPLENPFPDFLINTIKEYKGEKLWYLRLHPHQLEELEKFEEILLENEIKDKVNLKDASLMSLTALLSKTKIHITKSSSVIIEASYFNIPSIIIDPEGKQYYENQLMEQFKYYATDKFTLLEKIKKLEKLNFRNIKEANSNNINKLQVFFHS